MSIATLIDEITSVSIEHQNDDWDGCGATGISFYTVHKAIEHALSLPVGFKMPEVLPGNGGMIEFEWTRDRQNFSIYIQDRNKPTLYALIDSENNHCSGRFAEIDDGYPFVVFYLLVCIGAYES